jgi:hypothetical protein
MCDLTADIGRCEMSLNGVSQDLITPGEIGQSLPDQDHTIDSSAWRFLSAPGVNKRASTSAVAPMMKPFGRKNARRSRLAASVDVRSDAKEYIVDRTAGNILPHRDKLTIPSNPYTIQALTFRPTCNHAHRNSPSSHSGPKRRLPRPRTAVQQLSPQGHRTDRMEGRRFPFQARSLEEAVVCRTDSRFGAGV